MSRVRADRYTNREGTGAPTFTQGVNIVGVTSIAGIGSTALLVNGDARITGILTVGSSSITINGTTNRIGIGSVTPQTTLDLSQETGGIALPQGTTAQRPSGNNPYLRWNTTNSALEFYNGTDWVEIISDYFPSGSTILG